MTVRQLLSVEFDPDENGRRERIEDMILHP